MDYFVIIDGEQKGPFSREQLLAMRAVGSVADNYLCWHRESDEWQPLGEALVTPPEHGLPPLPPLPKFTQTPASAIIPSGNALRSASGIIGLLLVLLAIFNIGGCVNAERRLDAFTNGSDPNEGPRVLMDTLQGMGQDDPLRGISGLFERKRELTEEVENARLGAWLCLIGAAVACGVFWKVGLRKESNQAKRP